MDTRRPTPRNDQLIITRDYLKSLLPTAKGTAQFALRTYDYVAVEGAVKRLGQLCDAVETDREHDVLIQLLGLGIGVIGSCRCTDLADPFNAWRHHHHRLFNQAGLEILDLQAGLRRRMITLLRADLLSPARMRDGEECGELANKTFSVELIEKFLADDGVPEWCSAINPAIANV